MCQTVASPPRLNVFHRFLCPPLCCPVPFSTEAANPLFGADILGTGEQGAGAANPMYETAGSQLSDVAAGATYGETKLQVETPTGEVRGEIEGGRGARASLVCRVGLCTWRLD